ncbi:tetratricopeptide repeat protein [Candidatus Poribacteria bacterium]|nr:tetratricopeptide repeat protein [Candidatus Poribacteria bacterium]
MSNNTKPKFGSLVHQAETLRLMGKYDEAIAKFNRAIPTEEGKQNHTHAWAIAHRGETIFQRGLTKDYDKAEMRILSQPSKILIKPLN